MKNVGNWIRCHTNIPTGFRSRKSVTDILKALRYSNLRFLIEQEVQYPYDQSNSNRSGKGPGMTQDELIMGGPHETTHR